MVNQGCDGVPIARMITTRETQILELACEGLVRPQHSGDEAQRRPE